ncbi:MAG: hypothetical protein KIT84_01580 [Labilithrix sp.]|nr:hypothetical protein [Labilithrix sp.]MCW5809678.1 hypothetical protein [Labilithrix sp.]
MRWESAGWLLCAVPLVGLLELALHVKQTGPDVVPESDWSRARDVVKADLRPDDLVLFEPYWTDPLGRRSFGDAIATMKREGYSDLRRFARVYEVSIRGFHDGELSGWKKVKEEQAGAVTVSLFENPSHTPVIDDVVDLVTPERMSVARVDGANETPCTFTRGNTSGGSTVVPQGLLVPADKFVCSGGHVGVAVLHALDHHPHLCLYATPMKDAVLRLRFKDVTFGPSLHGHSGIQWVVERTPAAEKLMIAFSAFNRPIATVFHKVGAGWTGFELPTPDIDGKKGDLVAEIQPSAQRQFCFEATTRRAAK